MFKSIFDVSKQVEEPEEEEILGEGENLRVPPPSMHEEEAELEPLVEPDERILSKGEAQRRLQMLGKTLEGDQYAYLKINATGLKLTNIETITYFKHLLYVNVSENCLTLDTLQPLTKIPFLVLIHADKNLLTGAGLNRMEYLQVLILNYNKIISLADVYHPELTCLEVGYNQIKAIDFSNSPHKLKFLDLRYNELLDTGGINFPMLHSLYLAGNRINCLKGLEKLVNLEVFHLRSNPLKNLDGFVEDMKKLKYLNLRRCKVASMKQLKKLKVLPSLEVLIIRGCPIMGGSFEEEEEDDGPEEGDPEIRVELAARFTKLKRIDKYPVTEEERNDALELIKQWLEQGEEEEVDEEILQNEDEDYAN